MGGTHPTIHPCSKKAPAWITLFRVFIFTVRANDGVYVYQRYEYLLTLPLPLVYHGRVHGPRGSRVEL